jgi:hypothetical protein
MAEIDPRTKKVQQVGLHTNEWNKVDDIANKVDAFNRSHNGIFVEMEIRELTPDEVQKWTARVGKPIGKYQMDFTFANRAAQRAFWFGNW